MQENLDPKERCVTNSLLHQIIKKAVQSFNVHLVLYCACALSRLVTLASLAIEAPREVEASLALRGLLGHLDHEACKGTGARVESEAPKVPR